MNVDINGQEILAIISVVAEAIPDFKAIWQKISDNSNGTIRPLADLLAEAGGDFQDVITAAQAELANATNQTKAGNVASQAQAPPASASPSTVPDVPAPAPALTDPPA